MEMELKLAVGYNTVNSLSLFLITSNNYILSTLKRQFLSIPGVDPLKGVLDNGIAIYTVILCGAQWACEVC